MINIIILRRLMSVWIQIYQMLKIDICLNTIIKNGPDLRRQIRYYEQVLSKQNPRQKLSLDSWVINTIELCYNGPKRNRTFNWCFPWFLFTFIIFLHFPYFQYHFILKQLWNKIVRIWNIFNSTGFWLV